MDYFPEPDSHAKTEPQTELSARKTRTQCALGRRVQEELAQEQEQGGLQEKRRAEHQRAVLLLHIIGASGRVVRRSRRVPRTRAHPTPDAERVVFELSARWLSTAAAGADRIGKATEDVVRKGEQVADKGIGGGKEGPIGAGHLNLSLSAAGLEHTLTARGFRTALTPVFVNVGYCLLYCKVLYTVYVESTVH